MSTIQTAALSAAASGPVAAATRGVMDEQEDRFLRLLVAQMRSQDPLNPLDNAQVTTQLAQISTVRGIEQLNATVSSLLQALSTGQALQASALVGRGVLVPGSTLELANGAALAAVELLQPVDGLRVTITDASGRPVNTVALGAHGAGLLQIQWDGATESGAPAAPGVYTFAVDATAGGKPVPVNRLALGVVEGVTPGKAGTTITAAGLGTFSLEQIRMIQ